MLAPLTRIQSETDAYVMSVPESLLEELMRERPHGALRLRER
jgi:hypothetical protein